MKNLLFAPILLFLSVFTASAGVIPPIVQTTFTNLYPEAEMPFWEIREGAWVANFSQEDQFTKVFFSQNGEWLETRLRISLDQLPAGVRDYLRTHYPSADYSYIGRVINSECKQYRVESETAQAIIIKILDPKGNLVSEETIGLDISLNPEPSTSLLPSRPLSPVKKN